MTSMSGTQRGGVVQVALVDQKLWNLSKRKLRPIESESEIYIDKKIIIVSEGTNETGKGVILKGKQQAEGAE